MLISVLMSSLNQFLLFKQQQRGVLSGTCLERVFNWFLKVFPMFSSTELLEDRILFAAILDVLRSPIGSAGYSTHGNNTITQVKEVLSTSNTDFIKSAGLQTESFFPLAQDQYIFVTEKL